MTDAEKDWRITMEAEIVALDMQVLATGAVVLALIQTHADPGKLARTLDALREVAGGVASPFDPKQELGSPAVLIDGWLQLIEEEILKSSSRT